MSARLLRCRNRGCPTAHGAVLGRVTADEGLAVAPSVREFRAYFDARKVDVVCPVCGTVRTFRGAAVFSDRGSGCD